MTGAESHDVVDPERNDGIAEGGRVDSALARPGPKRRPGGTQRPFARRSKPWISVSNSVRDSHRTGAAIASESCNAPLLYIERHLNVGTPSSRGR